MIGDLGDDNVLGGPGDGDEVAGGLGIDTVNGGPGNVDLVHGDYGYDRMDGGAGKRRHRLLRDRRRRRPATAASRSRCAEHMARGDGHDRLFRFESIEGSAFDDTLIGDKQDNVIDGGPGNDALRRRRRPRHRSNGDQGIDSCKGRRADTISCGHEKPAEGLRLRRTSTRRPAAAAACRSSAARRPRPLHRRLRRNNRDLRRHRGKGIAVGPGCARPSGAPTRSPARSNGPARWLMADLGPGNDSLRVEGSLAAVGFVRLAGGLGNDTIHGGPEDDLIEAGLGADKLYGGAGSDGLIGGMPGPTYLYGGANGDLLAAGGGCAGGALVGGPGRDDASFAETQAHPGLLYISFPLHKPGSTRSRAATRSASSPSDEDMEGSFDNDVLIGDSGPNAMLGQPGEDRIYGNGGDDVIDARDGVRDVAIQCAPGAQIVSGADLPPGGPAPSGHAFVDSFDPAPGRAARKRRIGHPVKGLGKTAEHQPSR